MFEEISIKQYIMLYRYLLYLYTILSKLKLEYLLTIKLKVLFINGKCMDLTDYFQYSIH